jgi:hypothetical protein
MEMGCAFGTIQQKVGSTTQQGQDMESCPVIAGASRPGMAPKALAIQEV